MILLPQTEEPVLKFQKNLNISSGEAEIETDDPQNEGSSPMKEEVNNRKRTKA